MEEKVNVTVRRCGCERCGYKWIPRKKKVIICPKCKSPYWNVKRKEKVD
jgi:Zn finger protein HypA/HybF involved in hydrogenase expression